MSIWNRLISAQSAGLGAAILAGAYAINGVLAFVRSIILANVLGASSESDAYTQGFVIPDLLLNFLVMGFVTGALMPILIATRELDRDKANDLASSFLLLMSVIIVTSVLLVQWQLPAVLEFWLGEQPTPTLISVSRVLLWTTVVFAVSNTLGMYLQVERRFTSVALSPVLYTLGIITGAVLWGQEYGALGVAYGALGGSLLHLLIRLMDWPQHLHLRLDWEWSPQLRQILILGLPKMVAMGSFTLAFALIARGAEQLPDGTFTTWSYARDMVSFPVLLFGLAVATAVSPILAQLYAQKKSDDALIRFDESGMQILSLTLPSAVGLMVLSPWLTSILFGHGAFGADAAAMMAVNLGIMAAALPLEAMNQLLSRILLMQQRTVSVMIGKLTFLGTIAAVLAWMLPSLMALGYAFALAIVAETIVLQMALMYRDVRMNWIRLVVRNWHVFVACLVMMGVLYWLLSVMSPSLVMLLVLIASGATAYIGTLALLRAPQLRYVQRILKIGHH